jgi:hypothetical protein
MSRSPSNDVSLLLSKVSNRMCHLINCPIILVKSGLLAGGTICRLLAPYKNRVRVGQEFSSYTPQSCVDDAAAIDFDIVEGISTNDGTNMRSLAEDMGRTEPRIDRKGC